MVNKKQNYEKIRKELRAKQDKYNRHLPACKDCGCEVGASRMMQPFNFNMMYMLEDELWLEVNDGKMKGHLCLICAQLRLGRKFVPTDFKAVPLNFRERGALSALFPGEFRDHMRAFVTESSDSEEE